MFEVLVIAMLAILVAFAGAWAVSPGFRAWIETPKHRMLARERRFESGDEPEDRG